MGVGEGEVAQDGVVDVLDPQVHSAQDGVVAQARDRGVGVGPNPDLLGPHGRRGRPGVLPAPLPGIVGLEVLLQRVPVRGVVRAGHRGPVRGGVGVEGASDVAGAGREAVDLLLRTASSGGSAGTVSPEASLVVRDSAAPRDGRRGRVSRLEKRNPEGGSSRFGRRGGPSSATPCRTSRAPSGERASGAGEGAVPARTRVPPRRGGTREEPSRAGASVEGGGRGPQEKPPPAHVDGCGPVGLRGASRGSTAGPTSKSETSVVVVRPEAPPRAPRWPRPRARSPLRPRLGGCPVLHRRWRGRCRTGIGAAESGRKWPLTMS